MSSPLQRSTLTPRQIVETERLSVHDAETTIALAIRSGRDMLDAALAAGGVARRMGFDRKQALQLERAVFGYASVVLANGFECSCSIVDRSRRGARAIRVDVIVKDLDYESALFALVSSVSGRHTPAANPSDPEWPVDKGEQGEPTHFTIRLEHPTQ